MSDLVNYTPIPIGALLNQINLYKYNPSAIQRVILDNLYQYTQGQVNIVDPTNPFVFLLEASCVNTSVAIQESLNNLQKQYPILAQSYSDLYLHMSDRDYLNVFSQPSENVFTWKILLNELLLNLVDSPLELCKKAIIPRNSYVTVAGMTFSLNYPIVIRQYYNQYIEVAYDTTSNTPIQTLSTNIIPYSTITDASNTTWLVFDTLMMQFGLQTTSFTIQASTILSQTIPFSNSFYFARVFYQNSNNSPGWTEINTIYDQNIYDYKSATAAIQVDNINNVLTVTIPPIYVDSNLISGILRVDIYTTTGSLSINLSNYTVSSFVPTIFSPDPVNDYSLYTSVLANVSYIVYSANTIVGGSSGMTFDQLRSNVIMNTTGPVQVPITSVQLQAQLYNTLGFNIIKDIDYITNRVFQATSQLPLPMNTNLITAAALSINTLYLTLSDIQSMPQLIDNITQSTIPSNTIFIENNGILSIYSKSELSALMQGTPLAISTNVNANNFLYNPFHYVLDYSGNEFAIRAYNLDSPSSSLINFLYQNQTLQLIVNTGNIQIVKVPSGFQITIVTSSAVMYQNLADSYVQVLLGFIPVGEKNYAFIRGVYTGTTAAKERIFTFNVATNYFIDVNDSINFTNFNMYNESVINVSAAMLQTFDIFYTTTSITTNYVISSSDNLIAKFLLPPNAAVITHEQVSLTLGYSLHNLWKKGLVNIIGSTFQTYPNTVYATYLSDTYATDPVTNSIFTVNNTSNTLTYTLSHRAGDPILNTSGHQVVLHNAGDPVLDSNGNNILNTGTNIQYASDILLVDGKYFFATDPAYIAYITEIRNTLNTWITQSLSQITNQLLEQTNIYFYPSKTYSTVTVALDTNTVITIQAAQSFKIDLYITTSSFNNIQLRSRYNSLIISTLNSQLKQSVVSISNISKALEAVFDANVISFSISGLGGASNYNTVTLVNANENLSINKILYAQENNLLTVTEDVTITYHNYQA